jgi:outer membrane protein
METPFLQKLTENGKLPVILTVAALLLSVFAIYKSSNSASLVYVDVNKLIQGYNRTKVLYLF